MTHIGEGEHPQNTASNTNRSAIANENIARVALAKREEKAQIVSVRQEVAADGGTFNLHLKNPDGSGWDANMFTLAVSTTFEGIFDVYDRFSTAPSGGTAQTPDNLLMDTDDTNGEGNMQVNADVSYSSSKTHYEGVIPSGGSEKEPIGGVAEASAPLIEPNREIVVEVVNQSANPKDGTITLIWTEERK